MLSHRDSYSLIYRCVHCKFMVTSQVSDIFLLSIFVVQELAGRGVASFRTPLENSKVKII